MIETTRRSLLAGMAALPFLPGVALGQAVGRITRLDPGLDALIDVDSPIEVVASGFKWAEGPVWVKKGGYLLFSDVPMNIAYRWKAGEGAKPFLKPSGLAGPIPAGVREAGSNGMILDGTGALLMADSGTRAIARVDLATKKKTIVTGEYEGKKFNSCNDLVIGRDGIIYFTDPPYGLSEGDESPLKQLAFNGVYRVNADGSDVSLIDKSLKRPNGIGISPGFDRLYVSQSDPDAAKIFTCELAADGSASTELVPFFDFSAEVARKLPGLPDGMKVAKSGHLFASGPGGIWVIAPDGRKLGVISTGKAAANCCFGEDGKTLFITSSDMVVKVRLKVAGW
ncbi:SMP-30/gluconolactonase/LRE family protein [Sphingomonas sp. NIBR02145]|uniref:SMP-30/gluconolactonase/LRE family protein n=1 Tax=Sphingomonas sp. NIBR02145 TaxID=3014784 RepID=UPI0022B2C2FD|nr:SMP-30/gluconolactonase/LRE family protein [Sphingomonas sp. NIBR02145]WHU02646.1 SMP-30/gluconolactonase/LRE family protein [Sphingomonas sp. NIBR02145]